MRVETDKTALIRTNEGIELVHHSLPVSSNTHPALFVAVFIDTLHYVTVRWGRRRGAGELRATGSAGSTADMLWDFGPRPYTT